MFNELSSGSAGSGSFYPAGGRHLMRTVSSTSSAGLAIPGGGQGAAGVSPQKSQQQQQQQQQQTPPLPGSTLINELPSSFFHASPSFLSSQSSGGTNPSRHNFLRPDGQYPSKISLRSQPQQQQQYQGSFIPQNASLRNSQSRLLSDGQQFGSGSLASGVSGGYQYYGTSAVVDSGVFAWIVRCSLMTSMPVRDLNIFITDSLRMIDKLVGKAAELSVNAEAELARRASDGMGDLSGMDAGAAGVVGGGLMTAYPGSFGSQRGQRSSPLQQQQQQSRFPGRKVISRTNSAVMLPPSIVAIPDTGRHSSRNNSPLRTPAGFGSFSVGETRTGGSSTRTSFLAAPSNPPRNDIATEFPTVPVTPRSQSDRGSQPGNSPRRHSNDPSSADDGTTPTSVSHEGHKSRHRNSNSNTKPCAIDVNNEPGNGTSVEDVLFVHIESFFETVKKLPPTVFRNLDLKLNESESFGSGAGGVRSSWGGFGNNINNNNVSNLNMSQQSAATIQEMIEMERKKDEELGKSSSSSSGSSSSDDNNSNSSGQDDDGDNANNNDADDDDNNTNKKRNRKRRSTNKNNKNNKKKSKGKEATRDKEKEAKEAALKREDAEFASAISALAQLWQDSFRHKKQLQQLLSTEHQWQLMLRSATTVADLAQSRVVLIPDTYFGNPITESTTLPSASTGVFVLCLVAMFALYLARNFVEAASTTSSIETALLVVFVCFTIFSGISVAALYRKFLTLQSQMQRMLNSVVFLDYHEQQLQLQGASSVPTSAELSRDGSGEYRRHSAIPFTQSYNYEPRLSQILITSPSGAIPSPEEGGGGGVGETDGDAPLPLADTTSQDASADGKNHTRTDSRDANEKAFGSSTTTLSPRVPVHRRETLRPPRSRSQLSNYGGGAGTGTPLPPEFALSPLLKLMPGGVMVLPDHSNKSTSIGPASPDFATLNSTASTVNLMGGPEDSINSSVLPKEGEESASQIMRSSSVPNPLQARSTRFKRRLSQNQLLLLQQQQQQQQQAMAVPEFSSLCLDMAEIHKLLFIVCFDYNMKVTQWNATAEDVTGFLARDVVGRKLRELMVVPEEVVTSLVRKISTRRENIAVQVQSLTTGTSMMRGTFLATHTPQSLVSGGDNRRRGSGNNNSNTQHGRTVSQESLSSPQLPTLQTLGGDGQGLSGCEPVGFAFVSALSVDDNRRASSLVLNFKHSMLRQTVEALSIEARSALQAVAPRVSKTLLAENMAARVYRAEIHEGKNSSLHPLTPLSMEQLIRYIQSMRILVRGSSWEHIAASAQEVQDDWEIFSPEQILSSSVRYSLSKVVESRCGGGNMELPKDLRISKDAMKITKAMVAACPSKCRVLIYGEEVGKQKNRRLIFCVESVSLADGFGAATAAAPSPTAAATSSTNPTDVVHVGGSHGNKHTNSKNTDNHHGNNHRHKENPQEQSGKSEDSSIRPLDLHSNSTPVSPVIVPAKPFDFDELLQKISHWLLPSCGVLVPSSDVKCVMLYLPCISSKLFVEGSGGGSFANGLLMPGSASGGSVAGSSGMGIGGGGAASSSQLHVSNVLRQQNSFNMSPEDVASTKLVSNITGSSFGGSPGAKDLLEKSGGVEAAMSQYGHFYSASQSAIGSPGSVGNDPLTLATTGHAAAKCPISVAMLFDNPVDVHNLTLCLFSIKNVSVSVCQSESDLIARLPFVDLILVDWELLPEIEASKPVLKKQLFVLPCVPEDWEVPDQPELEAQVIFRPFERQIIAAKVIEASELVLSNREKEQVELDRNRIFQARNDAPWTRGKLLGRGSFGTVYEAVNDMTGGVMAVKCFDLQTMNERAAQDANPEAQEKIIESLTNEIAILCKLSHSNIVHYFYCERSGNSLTLFMELCDRSLQDLIKARRLNKGRLEASAPTIVRQTLQAVAYLHERGVIHRDLKPMNILMRGDSVKLTDFGTAAQLTSANDQLTETQGTFRFMAPEVFRGQNYNASCDIWSLGCVLAEMLNLNLSFMDAANHMGMGLADLGVVESGVNFRESDSALDEPLQNSVTSSSGGYIELPPVSPSFTADARDFVGLCLQVRPENRPLAQALLLHPYVDLGQGGEEAMLLSQLKGGERRTSMQTMGSPGPGAAMQQHQHRPSFARPSAAAAAASSSSAVLTPPQQGQADHRRHSSSSHQHRQQQPSAPTPPPPGHGRHQLPPIDEPEPSNNNNNSDNNNNNRLQPPHPLDPMNITASSSSGVALAVAATTSTPSPLSALTSRAGSGLNLLSPSPSAPGGSCDVTSSAVLTVGSTLGLQQQQQSGVHRTRSDLAPSPRVTYDPPQGVNQPVPPPLGRIGGGLAVHDNLTLTVDSEHDDDD